MIVFYIAHFFLSWHIQVLYSAFLSGCTVLRMLVNYKERAFHCIANQSDIFGYKVY